MLELVIFGIILLVFFYYFYSINYLRTNSTLATINQQGNILGAVATDFLVLDLPMLPMNADQLQIYNMFKNTGSLIAVPTLPVEYYITNQLILVDWKWPDTFENSLWKYVLKQSPINFNYKYFQLGNFAMPLFLAARSNPDAKFLMDSLSHKVFPFTVESPKDLFYIEQMKCKVPYNPLGINTVQFLSNEEYGKYEKSKLTRDLTWTDLLHFEDLKEIKPCKDLEGFINVKISDENKDEFIYAKKGPFIWFAGTLIDEEIIGRDWRAKPTNDGLNVKFDEPKWFIFNTSLGPGTTLILENQLFKLPLRDCVLNKTYEMNIRPPSENVECEIDNRGIGILNVKELELIYI